MGPHSGEWGWSAHERYPPFNPIVPFDSHGESRSDKSAETARDYLYLTTVPVLQRAVIPNRRIHQQPVISGMFTNGPEYEGRLGKPFAPPPITLKEIYDAVPKHLLRKNLLTSTYYCVRDIGCCIILFCFASAIECIVDDYISLIVGGEVKLMKITLWVVYWWWQGLVFASFFFLGHEVQLYASVCTCGFAYAFNKLGHQGLYESQYVNDTLGFLFHSFILSPFFAWKASHNAHHRAVASIERDENYVPYERSEYNLPPRAQTSSIDYSEIFDETPVFTFLKLFAVLLTGWWMYLGANFLGSRRHPNGTNHFSPYAPIFRPHERTGIILSDIGILVMCFALCYAMAVHGFKTVMAYYFIPYMVLVQSLDRYVWKLSRCFNPSSTSIALVMVTFLQHSDPTVPHYHQEQWTWIRGAAATIDRPLLGWMGRFFLHNASHDHVAHHYFSYAPFYNLPEITKYISGVLKEHYVYDSTNTFYALYRSFTQCVFVEDEDSIAFYRDKHGNAVRQVEECLNVFVE
ncbi:uncharacterized protein FIBRA_09497 [Fibroporia radiculosa]|uniref:Fatty acid desaturase domain-containing protein n=1 Tax=Fibroporia radiculosa TaxID=599839 RepID=J7S6L1_9APHY|nr:uncharacterized protein FIBRA_09497 [Fibroporia radiculosa]CCM07159.1 predicted protein [Fibroporia radiculosa]